MRDIFHQTQICAGRSLLIFALTGTIASFVNAAVLQQVSRLLDRIAINPSTNPGSKDKFSTIG